MEGEIKIIGRGSGVYMPRIRFEIDRECKAREERLMPLGLRRGLLCLQTIFCTSGITC